MTTLSLYGVPGTGAGVIPDKAEAGPEASTDIVADRRRRFVVRLTRVLLWWVVPC